MKNILNKLKSIVNLINANSKKEAVNCNYSNNYYGDQYCQKGIK